MHSLRASPVFAFAVLLTLGLAGFNGSMVVLMNLPGGAPGGFGQMTHFTTLSHRTHDLTFGFLFIPAVVGMLAQLRRPSKNVAGQLMALIPWVGLVLTLVLTFVLTNNTNVFGPQWAGVAAATLIATILHPTWRDFFRSFSVSRINRVMLALVIIAAVPLLAFASTNLGLQGTVTDDHAFLGHYGFMAAFGFTVIGVGLLASLRPDGWWLPAWVAGLLPALLGLTSLVYPDSTSSLGLVWALGAIAWGVGFVAAAELTQDAEGPALLGSLLGSRRATSGDDTRVRPTEDRPPGTPVWVNVFGGIALVVVVLLVGQSMIRIATGQLPGGGPGLHGPGGGEPVTDVPDVAFTLLPRAEQGMFLGIGGVEHMPNPTLRVPLGSVVQVTLQNEDGAEYDIYFPDFEAKSERVVGSGSTTSLVFVADREGEFVYYSTVPGHREAGMEGRIVVGE